MPVPNTGNSNETDELPRHRGFHESRSQYRSYLNNYNTRKQIRDLQFVKQQDKVYNSRTAITKPGGVPVELPRSYTPINGFPLPLPDPSKYSSPEYISPYIGATNLSPGPDRNIGGDQDFNPSIAARGIGLNVLQDLLRSNPMEYAADQRQALGRMNGGIPGFGDSLSREAMQSLLPSLQSNALMQDEGMHTKLRNLLTSSYGQGGAIRGNELANTGNWEEFKREKKLGATSVSSSSGPSGGGGPSRPTPGVGGIR